MLNDWVICLSYVALSVGLYIAWPSRWNVLAHMNLAFSLVAYVIPVLVLNQHHRFGAEAIEQFSRIMAIGAIAYVVGIILGTSVAGRKPTAKFSIRVAQLDQFDQTRSRRRLIVALVAGIVLTIIAGIGMGGLPLFAADPYTAKYFRGEYAESYSQVSIIYRLGTGFLTVLPPIALAMIFMDRKRRKTWIILSSISCFLMLATLQRGPMAEGMMVFATITLIWFGRSFIAATLIVGLYVVGTLFYTVLAWLGIGTLGTGTSPGSDFLVQIASTAPDVTDTLSFLHAWNAQGQPLTAGRTMWGGLVPGQFEWNPAVWSLVTQNYGANIQSIRSGGLRLPVSVWGLVNFGEIGLVFIPLAAGVIAGFLVRRLSTRMPSDTLTGTVTLTVLMNTGLLTVGSFYMLGYLEVVKAAALLWVLAPCLRVSKDQIQLAKRAITFPRSKSITASP